MLGHQGPDDLGGACPGVGQLQVASQDRCLVSTVWGAVSGVGPASWALTLNAVLSMGGPCMCPIVAILKFLIMSEPEALRFHSALGPLPNGDSHGLRGPRIPEPNRNTEELSESLLLFSYVGHLGSRPVRACLRLIG